MLSPEGNQIFRGKLQWMTFRLYATGGGVLFTAAVLQWMTFRLYALGGGYLRLEECRHAYTRRCLRKQMAVSDDLVCFI